MLDIELLLVNPNELFTKYLLFAEKAFGNNSYQANKSYIDWLVNNKGKFVLALDKTTGTIVGCNHLFCLDWKSCGETIKVTTAYNLFVLPAYRKGLGGILALDALQKAFVNSDCVLVPGVTGKLFLAYKKLGMMQVESCHYRKVIRPVKIGIKIIGSSAFDIKWKAKYFEEMFLKKDSYSANIKYYFSPRDSLIAKLVNITNAYSEGFFAPFWSIYLFKWRFFHPQGPKHILICLGDENNPTGYAILSMGPRRNLNVVRMMMLVVKTTDQLKILLDCVERFAKQCGGDILLSFYIDSRLKILYQELGFKEVNSKVKTCFCFKNKKGCFELNRVCFSAAAGDYGFEAIKPINFERGL